MELVDLSINPISEDAPSGDDVKYDADYEKLQSEIDKLSIPTSTGVGIDWNNVIKIATAILATRSKNLLVTAYLAAGLLYRDKIDGFAKSLEILKNMTENFWESLFPSKKRLRGRINAFEWWISRTDTYFISNSISPQKAALVEEVKSGLKALDQVVSNKIENGPNIIRLMDHVNRWPIQTEPKPSTAADSSTQAASKSTTTPGSSTDAQTTQQVASPDLKTTDDADRLLTVSLKQLIKIADHNQNQNPANPLSYHLNRIGSWLTIDKLPLSENNQTKIPPPEQSVRSGIENLIQNRDYKNALVESESRLKGYLFWLDLSRLSSEALVQMGGEYSQASEAVCLQTAMFVKRLPGIDKFCFSDGTPFADPQTRTWLKTIAIDSGGNDSMGLAEGSDADDVSGMANALTEGMKLFKDRKVAEALDLFQKSLTGSGSARSRFSWRIALSRFLMNIGKIDLAKPHFDELLRQIDVYKLEEWDPDLTVQALGVVYDGMTATEETRQAASAIFDQIGRISSKAALACLKS